VRRQAAGGFLWRACHAEGPAGTPGPASQQFWLAFVRMAPPMRQKLSAGGRG